MSDEERIARILGEWRERLDNGETVDPKDVIREHPDLEGPLRARFHALALLEAAISPVADPHHPLRSVAEDRYLDFELCGEGGMGIVYWALDQDLNREVAFKIVRPDGKSNHDAESPTEPISVTPPTKGMPDFHAFETLKTRFLQEAWITAGLEHPGIIPVYELGKTPEGIPYYTMRFLSGNRTLKRALDEAKGLGDRIGLLEPFLKVCDAVSYAHSRGVLHRDLKPDHFALGEFGEVVVLDWGLAKIKDRPDLTGDLLRGRLKEYRDASDLTTATSALGTPGYMAPEAALGRTEDVDERSDVYSLGAILYQILTGRLPFPLESWRELIESLGRKVPPTALSVEPRVPTELSRICARALAPDKDVRFGGADELAEEIRTWQRESTVDTEVTSLIREVKVALTGARQFTGEGQLRQLDRASALVARIEQLRPGHPRGREFQRACAEIREEATAARDKAVRGRVVRRILWPLAAVVLLASFGFFALDLRRREAEQAEQRTFAALRLARALALAHASDGAQSRDPMLSLLLAREAGRTQLIPTVVNRLHDAIAGSLVRRVLSGHQGRVNTSVFSPDGKLFLTASDDETARLWDQNGNVVGVLTGHDDRVRMARFSPDGTRIVTASDDMTARLWNLDGKETAVLSGHEGYVVSAVFSPSGRHVLTASWDNTARLWDLEGRQLVVFGGHQEDVASAVFLPSGDGVLTASDDGSARMFDLQGKLLAIFTGHEDGVWRVAASPAGDRIITAGNDCTARIFDLSGQVVSVLTGHEGRLCGAVYSPSGDLVLTTSADGTGRLWNTSGVEVAVLRGHEGQINTAEFSPRGDRVLTCGDDGTVRIWNLRGMQVALLHGHRGEVGFATYSPRGDLILSASDDHTARLWRAEPQEVALLSGHTAAIDSAVFSPDGNLMVTSSDDHTARVWDRDGREVAVLRGHTGIVTSAIFSPAGDRIITTSRDRTARVYSLDGQVLSVLRGHEDGIWSAAISPDGDRVVTASEDGTARLFEITGREIAVLPHDDTVWSAAFSADGRRIVTASADWEARLWDRNGKPLGTLLGHSGHVVAAAFSPDGRRVATASWDQTARIWDLNGRLLAVLEGHDAGVETVEFSPDGRLVLTASSDGDARLWDADGRPVAVLRGHEAAVVSAVFSPSGSHILTASWDGTVRLWDQTGASAAVLRGHAGPAVTAHFSPQGDRILTASSDGTARVWLARGGDLLGLADRRIIRELSAEERERFGDLLGTGE